MEDRTVGVVPRRPNPWSFGRRGFGPRGRLDPCGAPQRSHIRSRPRRGRRLTVAIRAVAPEDLDEILRHNDDAVPAVNELTRVDLDWFVGHAHSFLVAETDDGTIGGFLIGLTGPGLAYGSVNYAWFSARYDKFIYVDRIVVAAGGRGAGVGSQLYDAFAARGRDDGHGLMVAEVNVRPRNDVSLRFHDVHGFVPVGEQDIDGGAKRVTMLERRLGG